jgi:hypothetical protein
MRVVLAITIVGVFAMGGCTQQSSGVPNAPTAIAGSQATATVLPASASTSKQIVLASTNSAGAGGSLTPFGFWIWCFGVGTVPYTGQCTGSMYFYGAEPPKPVNDTAPPTIVGGVVDVFVAATDGSFTCALTGPVGKKVDVTVKCTNASIRPGTDTMPDSNVSVAP